MRYLFFIITVISLTLFGCKKSSNPVDSLEDGSLVISGKISEYSSNFTKLYASADYIPDSLLMINSDIQSDGTFRIVIPAPPEKYLSYYIPEIYAPMVRTGDSLTFVDSIHIADNNLKYLCFNLRAVSTPEISYSLQLNQSRLTTKGEYAKVGDYYISYYYFTIPTLISGYSKWDIATPDTSYEIRTEFNIKTKVGWNKVITEFKSKVGNKFIYEVTDIEAEKGNWIIGAYGSFPDLVRIL